MTSTATAAPTAIQAVLDDVPDEVGCVIAKVPDAGKRILPASVPVAGAKGTEATLGADPARLLRLKIRWV